MGSAGTGAYGGYVAADGHGGVVVRPAPRSPARLAGWAWREAVLALGRGVRGTSLVVRTARCQHPGRRPRASGGGGGDGRLRSPSPWRASSALSASNRLVTEPSLNTSLIARASSGAIDSTVSLSNRFSCGTGSVLVMMISLILEFFRTSTAAPERTPWGAGGV